MTALKKYQRLEASGLWRPEPDAQRREVVVSLGDASLTISEFSGRPLAHWSLAAVRRANRGQIPAIYHPDGDPGETLELPEDEVTMTEAIDRLLRAIERQRPRPGKLRVFMISAIAAAVVGISVFWLPNALLGHTRAVVPTVKRDEIGEALLQRLTRVTGQVCMTDEARLPLRRLALRVLGENRMDDLRVVPDGVRDTAHLPGGIILVNRRVLEDHEDPDVAAGYILAESLRARRSDPLGDLLDSTGLWSALRLLTTGRLPAGSLDTYAETLLTRAADPVPQDALIKAFSAAQLRSSPYAYARDPTGESTVGLIEADPRATEGSAQVLPDSDWLRLQGICDG
ncbi:hypothetical protein GCM10011415_35070 [Salipiger pallidus]|uniref:Uncharacterized protein n=1 Tax=Salipiger pallidus TaxID=1775170 RepID=A0A8J2ZMG9_9RHOB|nr:hypothetical protein [Salipiger pallidus]GGG82369.1 hypothetical protein GCM10011415_35070 [Salipiger pallidus]